MNDRQRRRTTWSGILLGIGFGGFFDGIVFHQILQWHHLVSHVDTYPVTTVAGLEANTLADGLFHGVTWIVSLVGLFLLWSAPRAATRSWSTKAFVGLLLMGWGIFNLVEGVVDHLILEVHHVREDSSNQLAWDLGFLLWGAGMLVGGLVMARVQSANGYSE